MLRRILFILLFSVVVAISVYKWLGPSLPGKSDFSDVPKAFVIKMDSSNEFIFDIGTCRVDPTEYDNGVDIALVFQNPTKVARVIELNGTSCGCISLNKKLIEVEPFSEQAVVATFVLKGGPTPFKHFLEFTSTSVGQSPRPITIVTSGALFPTIWTEEKLSCKVSQIKSRIAQSVDVGYLYLSYNDLFVVNAAKFLSDNPNIEFQLTEIVPVSVDDVAVVFRCHIEANFGPDFFSEANDSLIRDVNLFVSCGGIKQTFSVGINGKYEGSIRLLDEYVFLSTKLDSPYPVRIVTDIAFEDCLPEVEFSSLNFEIESHLRPTSYGFEILLSPKIKEEKATHFSTDSPPTSEPFVGELRISFPKKFEHGELVAYVYFFERL